MLARLPSLLLALLISAPLAGFLVRFIGSRSPEPLDRRPVWAQLVVVTCDKLPADLDRSGPGFTTLELRAARAALQPLALPELGLAAACMWTGRELDALELASSAVAPAWCLPQAAQSTGAATAALLDRPLVGAAHLTGFERLTEDANLGPESLLALAEEQLDQHRDQRSFLWIHLADPGPQGERLDVLLDGLCRALDSRGYRWGTLLAVTALTAEPGSDIPFWAVLPNDYCARRQGNGTATLADVTGLLIYLLHLPIPDVTRGELPLDATLNLAFLLRGATVAPPSGR